MPLWEIFHSMEAFKGPWDTMWLAGNITELYVKAGLPAFYVNVLFFPMTAGNFFIGGKHTDRLPTYSGEGEVRNKPSVRIGIEHIAIHYGDNQTGIQGMLDRIDHVLKAHIQEKGYAWEYNIAEPDPAKWKINGFVPPINGSAEQKQWASWDEPPTPPQ